MSDITDNIIPSNNDGGGPSRKRSRRSSSKALSNNNKDGTNSYYKDISFHERTSTGRPGTPHRYFEHSYDVSFQDSVDDTTSLSSSRSAGAVHSDEKNVAAALTAAAAAAAAAAEKACTNNKQSNTASNNNPPGNQVVHRHVNGLCIITAGNILQTTTLQQQISSNDDSQSQHQSIESIKYHVQVAPDAQSARGKLRAKNKKRKKNNNNNNNHDSSQDSNYGDVSPTDTLCEVTLTNGEKVILKCCVQGTIIELNHRLHVDAADTSFVEQQQQQQQQRSSNGADVDNDEVKAGSSDSCSSVVEGNASLLLSDPLLDGYLAVIMPNRGTQLPTL